MTAQTQPAQPEAIRLAKWIDSDFDPDEMAEFGFDEIAAELRRLHAENEQLRDINHSLWRRRREHRLMRGMKHLEVVKLQTRIAELEAEIAFKDSEFRRQGRHIASLQNELFREAQRTANEKLRADQMTEQHRMQAAMNSEARAELAQLRESKPLSDVVVDEFLGEANRGFDIEREHYFKAFRDAERAHGIGEKT